MSNTDIAFQLKSFQFEPETTIRSKSKSYYVTGYISTTEPDLYDEIVPEEEIDRIVDQCNSSNVKLDLDHSLFRGNDHPGPVGRIIEAKKVVEDGVAKVWVKAQLDPLNRKFPEILQRIQTKFIDAFSIAYKAMRQTVESAGKTYTVLRNVVLANVAITGDPVNRGSRFDSDISYKSIGDFGIKYEDTMNLKAKYIRREGSSGNYRYFYNDGSAKKVERQKHQTADEAKTEVHQELSAAINDLAGQFASGKITAEEFKKYSSELVDVSNEINKDIDKEYNTGKKEPKNEDSQESVSGLSESTIDDIETDVSRALDITNVNITSVRDTKDGKKVIKMTSPDGNLQVVLQADGTLEGPDGIIKDDKGRNMKYLIQEKPSFIDILNNPESRELVEEIDDLEDNSDPALQKERQNLIKKLKTQYGYDYKSKEKEDDEKKIQTKSNSNTGSEGSNGENKVTEEQSTQAPIEPQSSTPEQSGVDLKSLADSIVELKSKVEVLQSENVELKAKLNAPMLKSVQTTEKVEEEQVQGVLSMIR